MNQVDRVCLWRTQKLGKPTSVRCLTRISRRWWGSSPSHVRWVFMVFQSGFRSHHTLWGRGVGTGHGFVFAKLFCCFFTGKNFPHTQGHRTTIQSGNCLRLTKKLQLRDKLTGQLSDSSHFLCVISLIVEWLEFYSPTKFARVATPGYRKPGVVPVQCWSSDWLLE